MTTFTVDLLPPATTTPSHLAFGNRRAATNSGDAIVNVPSSQAYYWTRSWQANERLAAAELACGEGVEFSSADDALAWLNSDD